MPPAPRCCTTLTSRSPARCARSRARCTAPPAGQLPVGRPPAGPTIEREPGAAGTSGGQRAASAHLGAARWEHGGVVDQPIEQRGNRRSSRQASAVDAPARIRLPLWPSTAASGRFHRSATPSSASPTAALYAEELMGEEGFSLGLVAALPPRASRRRSSDARIWDLPRPVAPSRTTRSPAATCGCTSCSPTRTPSADLGHRPPPGARQRRRPDLVRRSPTKPSPLYRNAIGDECVYIESGRGAVETDVRRAAVSRPATTS